MIWSLQLRILCRKTAAISINNGIHTSAALSARGRAPRAIPYEPGLRHYEKILEPGSELPAEIKYENDLEDNLDIEKIEEAYDSHVREKEKQFKKNEMKIIAKKFFAPRAPPPTLTWNERQCIKYLHNEDPIQWDIKTLSESFPAIPETIKKVIKSKKTMSIESAKLYDSKVQKNWELLAEGKLDADPNVLNHLKKFINRREVLLEQIKNADFYLPEVKKEIVWNQGEMNKIVNDYDKALSRLVAETQQKENLKVLSDGVSEEKNLKKEGKSNLDLVHEKIEMESRKDPYLKDSFKFGRMINAFGKNVTLEELETTILKKKDKRKKLDLIEKAVLDSKLGVNSSENFRNISKNYNYRKGSSSAVENTENDSSSSTPQNLEKSLELENRIHIETDKCVTRKVREKDSRDWKEDNYKLRKNEDKLICIGLKSHANDGSEISKILYGDTSGDTSVEESKITEEKPEIDFSDPARLHREKLYYDQQVADIKNTAFWNSSRRSQEKAMAESNKGPVEIPAYSDDTHIPKTAVLSADVYPERINIPKDKRGSGYTFKVKDCYYDDDGKFLYRVPGMIK